MFNEYEDHLEAVCRDHRKEILFSLKTNHFMKSLEIEVLTDVNFLKINHKFI
jgi:hypothetical protein